MSHFCSFCDERLDKAECLLASYSAASASGSPPSNNGSATLSIPEAAQRAILECEARSDRAEHAGDEADTRQRVLSNAWEELNRYLHIVELRAADACAGFAHLVAEGGSQLVLAPMPLPGYLALPAIPPSTAIMLAPQRSHRHSSSLQSSHGIPPFPRPHPTARVRPRSGSFDESLYPAGQPPAKCSHSERDYNRVRAAPTSVSDLTPHQSHPHGRLDIDVHSSSHLPSPYPMLHPTLTPPRHSHACPHSRSSSHSSQRSLSIDEILLEASTKDPRPHGEPQSPRAVIAHHQHPHTPAPSGQCSIIGQISGAAPGPLDQPGEQRMYQTHIFPHPPRACR